MYAKLLRHNDITEINMLWWGKDLQKEISIVEWHSTHVLMKSISINSAIRENFYKLRQRWYMTPVRVHKMFPEIDNLCWRCKKEFLRRGYIKR